MVGRLTGRANTTYVEDVLRAGAQVIIDYGTVTGTYRSLTDRAQGQTGIPYVLINGAFERVPDAYRLLDRPLDRDDRAEYLAGYFRKLQERTRSTLDKVPPSDRPRVYYGRGPDGLETGGINSINVELLTVMGATNVAQHNPHRLDC